MAKATVTCTCETCGKLFERTAHKRNTTEARAWEAWAAGYFTECGACYGRRSRKAEADAGLAADIQIDLCQQDGRHYCIVCSGDTYPIKDQLKTLGARWTDDYPKAEHISGDLSRIIHPPKRWAIDMPDRKEYKRKMYDTIRALQELGFSVTAPSGIDLDAWIKAMEAKK